MKSLKFDLCSGVAVLLLLKLLCVGFSPADAAGASFILAGLLGRDVISYLFPKRPDLFKEFQLLGSQIQDLRVKTEETERGLTAIRMSDLKGMRR